MNEKEFIENLVPDYITSSNSSQVRVMRDLIIRTVKPYIKGGILLDLGCEVGYMSELLSKLVDVIHIVDGSEEFINKTKERNISNATFIHSLFEDIKPEPIYDYIFMSHVLEHLNDIATVLNIVKKGLKQNGLLFVIVPNARAASRQLARHMNLINDLYELTPNDIRGGHRRVYDKTLLNRDLINSGFEIIHQGGILFKPFADFQLDKMIDSKIIGQEQIDGLYSLGFEYPDMCADLYAICRKLQ